MTLQPEENFTWCHIRRQKRREQSGNQIRDNYLVTCKKAKGKHARVAHRKLGEREGGDVRQVQYGNGR
jgi:hypothetical protein